MGTKPVRQSSYVEGETNTSDGAISPSAPPLDGPEGPPPYEDMRKFYKNDIKLI